MENIILRPNTSKKENKKNIKYNERFCVSIKSIPKEAKYIKLINGKKFDYWCNSTINLGTGIPFCYTYKIDKKKDNNSIRKIEKDIYNKTINKKLYNIDDIIKYYDDEQFISVNEIQKHYSEQIKKILIKLIKNDVINNSYAICIIEKNYLNENDIKYLINNKYIYDEYLKESDDEYETEYLDVDDELDDEYDEYYENNNFDEEYEDYYY
jgi:hypothetical protein